jgi:hypothetical protein
MRISSASMFCVALGLVLFGSVSRAEKRTLEKGVLGVVTIRDRSQDTVSSSSASTKGPEQVRITVFVDCEGFSVRSNNSHLQNVVSTCDMPQIQVRTDNRPLHLSSP